MIGWIFLLLMQTLPSQNVLTSLPCSDCHTPDHWRPLVEPLLFHHDKTGFPLQGKHQFAECIQCHTGDNATETHQFEKADPACGNCHMDIHFNGFGKDCQNCHNLDSWDMVGWWKKHELTLFPLTGAHAGVSCEACHGVEFSRMATTLTTDCLDCHQRDFTREVLKGTHPDNSDCIICHNTRTWVPIDMSHHDRLFPIYSGKHKGKWSTCNAECHVDPTDYSLFSCGLNGICHEHDQSKMDSKHREEGISGYVYESTACLDCHPSGGEGGD